MKTAVITGASSGIGLTLGKELHAKGYTVFGLCRTKPATDDINHIVCDVTQEESVRTAIAEIIQKASRIDLLVTCAGMGIAGSIEFMKEEQMKRQVDVNLYGVVRTIQACLPYMRKQAAGETREQGRIVIIGSLAAVFPLPFQGMYSMTKAALSALACSLRNELSGYKISVTCLLPGDVHTNFTSNRVTSLEGKDAYPNMERVIAQAEKDETTGASTEATVKSIVRIIKKKHLAPTYTLDPTSAFLQFLTRLFSHNLVVSLIGKRYGS